MSRRSEPLEMNKAKPSCQHFKGLVQGPGCYGPNVCIPHNSAIVRPNSSNLGMWLSHETSALGDGIIALIKEAPGSRQGS